MSLANLSIIEKDDLIKKMPKDALKRELRDPTGNLPLYMIAARLKEVETMEKEFQAKQFAQDAQGEEPTIAHRLAREIMPQAPISGMAAMPSPQQRPDPQGQMAQQLAGPQNPMPTVYAQSGLKGAYPGDAPRVTAEMLAAAARRRKDSGKSRLYNQDRKSSFEETIKKGASPAAQMAAMFGIPSAIARQEERVYGGLDTLTPYQTEYNPLALRSKGFTSPTRTLSPGKDTEDASGLDYLKIMKGIAGDSDGLPTVFAENGYGDQSASQLVPVGDGSGRLISVEDLRNLPLEEPLSLLEEGQASYPLRIPSRPVPQQLSQPAAPAGNAMTNDLRMVPFNYPMDVDQGSDFDLTGNRMVPITPTTMTNEEYRAKKQQEEDDANKKAAALAQARKKKYEEYVPDPDRVLARIRRETKRFDEPSYDLKTDLQDQADRNEGFDPKKVPATAGDEVTVREATSSSRGNAQGAVPGVTPRGAPGAGAALPGVTVPGLGQRLGSGAKAVEIGNVDTIESFNKIYGGLLPDNSEARKKITKDLEATFKEEKERDAVPKGMKDIRSEYENRIKALDNSGLPFMTAAAAVLKGNQPTLVALTNAMIGYTAGNEQVKKQGLSLIKDMSKLDMDIATLDAAQREEARKAQVRLMQAREAEIKGDENRAAKTLELAGKARASAQALAVEKAKIESAAENRATQLAVATVKTDADRRAVDELTTSNFAILRADPKNKGKSDELLRAEAIKASVMAIQGRATSSFALDNQMLKQETANLRRDSQITKFFKNAADDTRRNYEIKTAAKKDNLTITGNDDMVLYGVHKGLIPITNALRSTPAGRSIIQQAEQKFGPQAAGKQDVLELRSSVPRQ